jgi:hypothetical protein
MFKGAEPGRAGSLSFGFDEVQLALALATVFRDDLRGMRSLWTPGGSPTAKGRELFMERAGELMQVLPLIAGAASETDRCESPVQ